MAPTWAAIWAGPVSFETMKELSLIKEVNWEIFKALLLSRIQSDFNFFASAISDGPGAVITLYFFSNLSLINFTRSL